MVLPTLWVALGILVLRDAVVAFLLYTLVGCLLGPWVLLQIRPLGSRGGWSFAGRGGDRPWMHLGAWLLTGGGLLGAYLVLRPWLLNPAEVAVALHALHMPDRGLGLFLLVFALSVPVAEEWWWRGQALPRCRAAFGPGWGTALGVVGFTAYHVVVLSVLYDPFSVLVRTLAILGGGFLFAAMALRTRGWRWAWSAHVAADLAIVTAFLLLIAPSM